MMTTKTVEIVAQADGTRTSAELLLCPDCGGERFMVYTPLGMQHVHFQCIRCGVSFCDGCQKEGAK